MVDGALTESQRAALGEMGIEIWVRRQLRQEPAVGTRSSSPAPADGPPDYEDILHAVRHCTACGLHKSRSQTVPGVGNLKARWMLIGEAPGGEEDRQGEPFVGPAGKLLNEMLRALGLKRSDVYITNILKCRPPNNRDPQPDEISACSGHLAAQIRLVAPKLILAVGRIAAQTLLQQQLPMARLRGRVHHYGAQKIPLVAIYHPSYLLRTPADKRKAWDDLRMARDAVAPQLP